MNTLTTTYRNLGFSTIPKDGWGDPIQMDENEHEGGTNDCREEYIWARGKSRKIPHFICPNQQQYSEPVKFALRSSPRKIS